MPPQANRANHQCLVPNPPPPSLSVKHRPGPDPCPCTNIPYPRPLPMPLMPCCRRPGSGGHPCPPPKKIRIRIPEPPDYPTPPLLWPLLSPNLSPPPVKSVLESANPRMDSDCASACPWSTARATARLRDGRPPGVVKQDKSSGGSVDTTKTRSGPQRFRMSGGQRPIGAAKGTQIDTEALCHTLVPPPPPLRRSLSLPSCLSSPCAHAQPLSPAPSPDLP